MRTPVVAAVALVVGVLVGVGASVAIGDDDPARDVEVRPEKPVDCTAVIGSEELGALGWDDEAARAEERLGRCEWVGRDGNITAGVLASPALDGATDSEAAATALEEACGDDTERDGYQESAAWLGLESAGDGCVVVPDGLGLYEVITVVEDDVVQVRVAVLTTAPDSADDVRTAMAAMVEGAAAAF